MKKRILFVSGSLASGGAERQIVNLSCLLSDNGYSVDVLCYAENDFYGATLRDKGIQVFCLNGGSSFNILLRCRRFIRKGNYEAVISFLETPNFINEFASIGGKKWKVIIGERSSQTRIFTSAKGHFYSFFHRFADALVCNSYNAEQMWRRYSKVKVPEITTIYNVIKQIEVNSEYTFKRDGRLCLLVVASYQPIKNMDGLAKALTLLTDSEKEQLQVDWYGRKEYSDGNDAAFKEIDLFVKDNNLDDILFLHGETQGIADIMNQSDVIGLFSKAEGLPNTICEGMCLGKPIIMTRVSDYSKLVDNDNGVLCDWDNYQSIADAIRQMISFNEEQLLDMGASSRKKADNLFSNSAVLEKWKAIID